MNNTPCSYTLHLKKGGWNIILGCSLDEGHTEEYHVTEVLTPGHIFVAGTKTLEWKGGDNAGTEKTVQD